MNFKAAEKKKIAPAISKRTMLMAHYGGKNLDIAGDAGNPAAPPHEAKFKKEIEFIEIRQGALPKLDSIFGGEGAFCLTPFQWDGWLEGWQRSIGQQVGAIPVTAIGYYESQPVFVLPLAIIRRFGGRCLTWCAHEQSDYCAPILNAANGNILSTLDGEGILRQIATRIGGIDLVYVPKQPLIIHGIKNPFLLPGGVPHHAGAHAINFPIGMTWEATYERRRSAKTRSTLRKKRASLEKLGHVSFRIAKTEAEAQDLIKTCLDAKSRQLAALGHCDPFASVDARSFVINYFSSNCREATWVAVLEVRGKRSAIAFGFRHGPEWLLYQMAMSSGQEARYSPGTHLLMELMRHCTEQGVVRLDLALGDESYKAEWCDEHIELMASTLAFTLRGHVLLQMVRLRASARRRLAMEPKLYEQAKWLKGLARKLKLPL